MCFKGVALNDKEGVVVVSGDLRGLPREAVNVAVTVPLCDHSRSAAVNHVKSVNDKDNGPVGFGGATAHIHNGEVAVGDVHLVVSFGFCPDAELSLPVGVEAKIFQSFFALVTIGVHIADEAGRPASLFKLLDLIFVKYHCAGMNKCFHIIGGELGSHDCMTVFAASLMDVPVDGLKGGTFEP